MIPVILTLSFVAPPPSAGLVEATMDFLRIYVRGDETYGSYEALLAHLNSINGQLKGKAATGVARPDDDALGNTRRLYKALGCPLDDIRTVHVGGTNGKGTTSYKIAKVLSTQGIRTGLFVSPHISSFRERFQVDGEIVSEETFLRLVPRVLAVCGEQAIPASMFEVVFATFALVCQDAGCQAAVLEVGLGGRLDATNVVKTCFSIICSVSLDHTRILGSTIEAIASVKSGIFKKNVPCLVGKYCPVELLRGKAEEVGAPFNFIGHVVDVADVVEEKDGLPVDGAKDCTTIARGALTLLKSQLGGCFQGLVLEGADFEESLDKRPPCRWEVLNKSVSMGGGGGSSKVRVVMDVGHNPAAVAALAARIRLDLADFDVYVVYAASRGKDVGACMRAIGDACSSSDKVFFAECNYFRAITIEALRIAFEEAMEVPSGVVVGADGTLVRGVPGVLRATLSRAAAAQQHSTDARPSAVVVCGSLYMMAEARIELGMVETRD